jgi:hypothetical protein
MKHRLPWLSWGFVLIALIAIFVIAYPRSFRYLGGSWDMGLFLLFVDVIGTGAWIAAMEVAHIASLVLWRRYILVAVCLILTAISIGWQIRLLW